MPLEIQRSKKESSRSLVTRFLRAVRRSGIQFEIKKRRFYQKPLSRTAKKRSALRREEMSKKYERLKKLGKL